MTRKIDHDDGGLPDMRPFHSDGGRVEGALRQLVAGMGIYIYQWTE